MKPYYFGATPKMFDIAKLLRKQQTPAEEILWEALRNRQIVGFKFRRQHPIGRYIADFYCHNAKLCIEVDGNIHDHKEVKQKDAIRQEAIESCGITVLRFKNQEVMDNLDGVLMEISEVLQVSDPHPNPSPGRRGATSPGSVGKT